MTKYVKNLVTADNGTEVILTFHYTPISIEEWETAVTLELHTPGVGDDATVTLNTKEARYLARTILNKAWR